FARIEKRGLTTQRAVEAVCKALGKDPRTAGFAGMKERHAVTRQWISVHETTPEALLALALPNVRVLAAHPHDKKLKTGHLRSNRFVIRIREVPLERYDD